MRKIQTLLALLLVATMLLVSCKQATPTAEVAVPTEKPAEPTATKVAIVASEATPTAVEVVVSQYKESPLLADKVAAGELPPVDERISDNPLVTAPLESIGKYGGTIRTASWWNEVGNVLLYISEPPMYVIYNTW